MGVMNCNRNECDNIMCQTYITKIGYICYECISEFKEYSEKRNLETEGEINKELKLFMKIPKGDCKERKISVDEFFAENTIK